MNLLNLLRLRLRWRWGGRLGFDQGFDGGAIAEGGKKVVGKVAKLVEKTLLGGSLKRTGSARQELTSRLSRNGQTMLSS